MAGPLTLAERTEKRRLYEALRKRTAELTSEILALVPPQDFVPIGEKVGLKRVGKVLQLRNQQEGHILSDTVVHHWRDKGRTAFDLYRESKTVEPGSDDEELLRTMERARFTFFTVTGVEPELGVEGVDQLWSLDIQNDRLFLYDVAFSRGARPGQVLAGRLMFPRNICMTTGGATQVPQQSAPLVKKELDRLLASKQGKPLSKYNDGERLQFAATAIRVLVKSGALETVRYV